MMDMGNGSNAAGAAGAGVGGMLVGILIGAVIGGVVALLFAPQEGTRTREMVRNRMGQMGDVFRSSARDASETAERTAEQIRQSASEMKGMTQ